MTWVGFGCPRPPPLPPARDACTWAAAPEAYRQLQEVAYANHAGAGMLQTLALMLLYPGTVCFQQLAADEVEQRLPPAAATLLAEFGAAVLPLTVVFSTPHTVWMALANLGVLCAALAAFRAEPLAWARQAMRIRASRAVRKEGAYALRFTHVDAAGEKLRFVSEYRAIVMVTTCVAILAVDFAAVFPREHAKTEEYGYSLMDLGTGCIICSTAVCSKAARGSRQGFASAAAVARRLAALWPALAVGFLRLVTLWGIDYHVPTSEYGVHWNFFFTIACVAAISTLTDFGPVASAIAGAGTLVAYQCVLTSAGVADYVLHAPREGLLSANREGILSCVGYLGIHWLSVGLGAIVQGTGEAHWTAKKLLSAALAGIGAAWAMESAGLAASRRMCNAPYAAFVLGVNALVLGLLAGLDLYWPWPRRPMPHAYAGVSDNMLVTFLLANALTGVVNLTLRPLLVPAWAAMLVMAAYSLAWSGPVLLLHAKGTRLRFW